MSTVDIDAEESCATFEITELARAKRKFKLTLSTKELRLETEGQPAVVLQRSDPDRQRIQMLNGLLVRRLFIVAVDKKTKLSFTLEALVYEAVTAWLGPPTAADLQATLKQRLAWTFPLGILYILTSLPVSGNPAAGVAALPFDPFGFTLGAVLLTTAAISRWSPNRVCFILDAVWLLGLVLMNLMNVINGTSSNWWLLLILIQFHVGCEGIRQYRRFNLQPSAPK